MQDLQPPLLISSDIYYLPAEVLSKFLASGYRSRFFEYPVFVLCLPKCCFQRTTETVFGSIDPYSMVDFVMNRLNGAGSRNWMVSRLALRRATITNELSMPGFVGVVAKIRGDWPFVVLYSKENGQKADADNFVVRSSVFGIPDVAFTECSL